jgi:hypothetical protein
MTIDHDFGGAARSLLDREEVEGVLSGAFYRPQPVSRPTATARAKALTEKPAHYKVICISMYTQDLAELDAMVDALKAKGITKANRSALIRHALASVDLDRVPKGL